jgi:phosphatidylglycerol:prolipoprotein diacylglycerol transferase
MLVHPQFDPVAIAIGPLAVHWYGLMYVCAFAAFILLGRLRIRSQPQSLDAQELDDLLFWGVLGVVVGGRLGQVLFYEPGVLLQPPGRNPRGLEGRHVLSRRPHRRIAGACLACRKTNRSFLEVGDFVAPLVPLGLMFGRIGNFINGELWGRAADPSLPWAMIFPQAATVPAIRHSSTRPAWKACCFSCSCGPIPAAAARLALCLAPFSSDTGCSAASANFSAARMTASSASPTPSAWANGCRYR